jgi:ribosomal protein S3AE
MHQLQLRIVHHDHVMVLTWFDTHIIVHGSKRSNFRKNTLKLKIQLLVLTKKNLAKKFILIAQSVLKLDDSQGKTLRG